LTGCGNYQSARGIKAPAHRVEVKHFFSCYFPRLLKASASCSGLSFRH
jgi:hypothetical protein